MNLKVDNVEMSVLLMGLIQRRNTILDMLNIESISDSHRDSYNEEMKVVESLMERMFPGSVDRIKAAA